MEYCLLRLLSRAETIGALQKQGVVAFITATGAQLLLQLPLGHHLLGLPIVIC